MVSYMVLEYIITFCVVIITICLLQTIVINKLFAVKNEPTNKEVEYMSFEELNTVIDTITEEITNKHKLYYRLRDISIIPDMEKDITEITREIIDAFNVNFMSKVHYYYSKKYFYALITRKVQIFLIDYTNEYKPNTK